MAIITPVTPNRLPPKPKPTLGMNSLLRQPAPAVQAARTLPTSTPLGLGGLPTRPPANNGLPAQGTLESLFRPGGAAVNKTPALRFAAGQDPAKQAIIKVRTPQAGGDKTASEPDFMAQIEAEYGGIMADDAKAWGSQQHTLQNEMAGFQRSADSTNARMGGGIGGGSAGLAGAALGQGMAAYNSAAMEYNNRRRATQLAWMDKKIAEGQRQQEHTWEDQYRTEDWEHQLIQMISDGGDPNGTIAATLKAGDTGGVQGALDANQAVIDKAKAKKVAAKQAGLAKANELMNNVFHGKKKSSLGGSMKNGKWTWD